MVPNVAKVPAVNARRNIRLLGVISLVAGLTASSQAAGFFLGQSSGRPRLVSIGSRVEGTTTSVAIEATEPAPYVVTQPDPLTLLVELRNVTSTGVKNVFAPRNQRAVSSVTVEDFKGADGAMAARVRINLAVAATHRARSSRTMIYVDIEPSTGAVASGTTGDAARPAAPAPGRAPGPVAAARPAPGAPPSRDALRRAGATPDAGGPAATTLTGVRAIRTGEGLTVLLTGNGRLLARSIEPTKDGPPRLVLDFPGLSSNVPAVTAVNQDPVDRVRVAAFSTQPLVTRVVVDLAGSSVVPRVESSGPNGQELRLVFPAASTAAASTPAMPRPVPDPAVPPVSTLSSAPPSNTAPAVTVVNPEPIRAAEPAPPFAQLAPPTGSGPSDTTVDATTLRRPAAKDGVLPPRTRTAAPVTPPSAAQATPSVAAQQPPVVLPSPPTAPAQPPPEPPAPVVGAQGSTTVVPAEGQQKQYTGFPVSFDFQDVDLRTVLRVFAQETGLNIIIDPSVTGTVNVQLRDVPWDQALDIILRANKLGYTVEGSVVRIVQIEVLTLEEEQRQKLRAAQALAGDLRTYTKQLSYAKADDLKTLLTESGLLTQRGRLQVDPRTNTVIISDLPAAVTGIDNLIALLDRPQPQVDIEARIIQSNRDFARRIGIQWGLAGRAAPELGNTTGLAFPNRGAITGRTGGNQPPGQGIGQTGNENPTAVNLPVTGATTAIGLAMGAVNGAFNLDVALSALETSGQGRILSTPRISTQNNVEASIVQGIQIPIQVISNNTVTVTFQDAALTLRVTPQITAANTVIMRVFLDNGSADFTRAVNNIPPINTQRATTTLLVNDGETTVIGGILTNTEQSNQGRTPGLNRIPILGWLFKRDEITDESRELLIFITPRIIRA
jgi:type IV pilus assembly protein PilQ